ncbi:hypothetical protein A3F52_03285 [Candidatus Uhrbacteria bacterium RIFCSPHIGHO2_12_FULL_47_11]|nr:MAG: hypothetical protein A3F52_03285 [Candidatus Uhrbacteria bacterium RIFCSPHIGHO2_12_FULL_47_11]
MPLRIASYLKGLLAVAETATCVSMSRVVGSSHDRLSRILNDDKLKWQTLLLSLILRIVGKLRDGYLIIDDTVIDKSFAKVIENLAWVFCSKKNRSVLGLNVVVLAWSNGTVTIPLAFKIWKDDGKTKIGLALELLSYARNFLKLQPKYVTFDCYYSAKKILKRLMKYKWVFYTQLKKNRKFNGTQLKFSKRNPYWMEQGIIDGNLTVLIVRHGKKYFATNNLEISKSEILASYRTRWIIETMFRMLYDKLGFEECESRSLRAQTAHITLCLMSFILLEQQRQRTEKSWYRLRREYRFNPYKVDLLFNKLKLVTA